MPELYTDKKIDPFLKWAGGKRWLAPHLVSVIPQYRTYYEPFLGSGCLFFALRPKRAVLADKNSDLINCYRQVRNNIPKVLRILKTLVASKDQYYKIRDHCYPQSDPISKAAYFIYLNKMCWNGLYRVNRQGKFNVPVGKLSIKKTIYSEENLLNASKLLKNTDLRLGDYSKTISGISRGDLVYFDPPYVTTHLNNGFIKYNSKLFSHQDERSLAKLATDLARKEINVIISNAAHPQIESLYKLPLKKKKLNRMSPIAADPNRRLIYPELLAANFSLRNLRN